MIIQFLNGVWKRNNVNKKIENLSFTDIKNIAILRHAALGDMVLTRCFIIEARKLFPNAKITLSVISNYTRGIPEDLVDRIHIIHGTDQRGAPLGERYRKIRELGQQDIIFDLADGARSVYTCLFTSATLKIGFPYRKIRSWLFYDITTCRSDLSFEVNDMLSMLHLFGAKTEYPHVYNMPGEAVKRDRPFIVYFIGASGPEKCWPRENFSQLIVNMANAFPETDHLVLGGLQDWERADTVLDSIGEFENVGGVETDTIEKTVSLMKGSDLLVSNDTGIRHVAITCNTPTVGIFQGLPYRYWPRYNNHDVVYPEKTFDMVSVDETFNVCKQLLERLSR
jgi:ADP-heptose:LPS heptosyltransferase